MIATADLINYEDGPPIRPKCLSYNDYINTYDFSLLTPNKITVNHLLSMAPIFGDISDAFGHILLDPQTALSCQIFLYKSIEDSLPTMDLRKAKVDKKMNLSFILWCIHPVPMEAVISL